MAVKAIPDVTKTTSETLGFLIGISSRQVENLRDTVFKDRGTKGSRGYDLAKAVQAYQEYCAKGKQTSGLANRNKN